MGNTPNATVYKGLAFSKEQLKAFTEFSKILESETASDKKYLEKITPKRLPGDRKPIFR